MMLIHGKYVSFYTISRLVLRSKDVNIGICKAHMLKGELFISGLNK
ncbi:hypothetical protein E6C60_0399 [Paenibacillus algicola]|uniref:Uncharacterized protein n=1 Tax=Paenibacillus algicola TaxID=2565926 RepID=A0A4P8XFG5_9BACL|nr:hypothetical protein E6C60_0399 [Paenibacillus algicola]